MCKDATGAIRLGILAIVLAAGTLYAQPKADWRRIGNSSIDLSLAGLATGPVERVWYSPDAERLFVRTRAGQVFETSDFETWRAAAGDVAEPTARIVPLRLPEPGAKVRTQPTPSPRMYALGRYVYRSDDAGAGWTNLTGHKSASLLGDGLADLTVSPSNDQEVAVASAHGVWRSVDGGRSWSGLNDGLPNLPVTRLLGLPGGGHGVRVGLAEGGSVEWMPGEKQAWHPAESQELEQEAAARLALSPLIGAQISALAINGDYLHLGTTDGRLAVSADRGRTWQSFAVSEGGAVERFWVDTKDPRVALAALSDSRAARVVRTLNGGAFWDDLTADLPPGGAHGVAADRATGAVYVATDRGLFLTYADLVSAGPPTPWAPIGSELPPARAVDVKLDGAGNQLYAALEGFGVYATLAPHRARAPRLVNSFDFSTRPAAPGSLVSVLGRRVDSARAGNLTFPVLAASESESQIQVPFEARGPEVKLALDGRVTLPLEIHSVSPAVLVDRDGTPFLLDGDTGAVLDAMTPARSHSRIQIFATGLGRVQPDWPTGLAAPLENPPRVAAPVRAWLDRTPVEVTRAVLAPGYIGYYLVEIELPKIVNYGPAELYLEVEAQTSNRVRVYIEP